MPVALRERGSIVEAHYASKVRPEDDAAMMRDLHEYLQLDVDLAALHAQWRHDPHLAAAIVRLPGLRILRQDPRECLFSFICSANNNISRIMLMVSRLRLHFGTVVGEYKGEQFFGFPTVDALAAVQEQQLRDLGFGYRAKCA